MSLKTLGSLAVAALASAVLPVSSQAQRDGDGARASNPTCLQLQSIDRTEVVNDRTILFHMKDRTIYQNELPNTCPTLRNDSPFMYRVTANRLCDTDTVTVLERWGFGFTPTVTCPLGDFVAIDAAAADELKKAEKAKKRSKRN